MIDWKILLSFAKTLDIGIVSTEKKLLVIFVFRAMVFWNFGAIGTLNDRKTLPILRTKSSDIPYGRRETRSKYKMLRSTSSRKLGTENCRYTPKNQCKIGKDNITTQGKK